MEEMLPRSSESREVLTKGESSHPNGREKTVRKKREGSMATENQESLAA